MRKSSVEALPRTNRARASRAESVFDVLRCESVPTAPGTVGRLFKRPEAAADVIKAVWNKIEQIVDRIGTMEGGGVVEIQRFVLGIGTAVHAAVRRFHTDPMREKSTHAPALSRMLRAANLQATENTEIRQTRRRKPAVETARTNECSEPRIEQAERPSTVRNVLNPDVGPRSPGVDPVPILHPALEPSHLAFRVLASRHRGLGDGVLQNLLAFQE